MELHPGLRDEHDAGPKRGRPPSALSTSFYRLNEKCNKTMWWSVCKYCYAAHIRDKASVPFPVQVHGRKDAWERHLSDCVYYVRVRGNDFASDVDHAGMNENGKTNKVNRILPPVFTPAETIVFWRLLLEYQAEALLPDSFVECTSFKRLLIFLNSRCGSPGAIPHRHIMGGRILNEYADLHSIEQQNNLRAIQTQTGGRVNFLSDVWETVAKLHVLGCIVALFGRIMTYGLKPAGDRHDGLAIAQQMEEVIEELIASEWSLGAVVTDNAGQCARARRILALRYPKIAFVHCFAHDINNLVKAILKTVFRQISADAAGVASFLNTSTSKWLVRAFNAMSKRYGDNFAIFTLCETRWNSMQACFASLLRARGALEDMVFSYRNSSELTDKLRVLGDNDFWSKLDAAEKIIRPLCTASFRLQRDENTVADVVVSFMDIYRGFASTDISDSLIELVEARWYACEQPLFILGFFLHPGYVVQARGLPSTVLSEVDDVCQIAQYYYRRYVDDDDSGLRGEMFEWIQGSYTTSRSVDFNDDSIVKFWTYEKNTKKNSKLPLLALAILSIAVNTATCERLFSELALILTPKRNRMGIQKTMKHQILRQYVREKNLREKMMPTSSKKLLRTIDPQERPCIATPQNSARTTPVHATSARTTPIRATPARTTPVRATPARTTPIRATPARTARVHTTPSRTTPVDAPASRTISGTSTHSLGRSPPHGSQNQTATPLQHEQGQLQSPPLARVLFSEPRCFRTSSERGIRQIEPTPSPVPVVPISRATSASHSNSLIPRQTHLDNHGVDSLTAELETVALSDQQLDEYLEHFDWEEIGEYGDENTVRLWGEIFATPTTVTGHSSDGNDSEAADDPGIHVDEDTNNSDTDQSDGMSGDDGASDIAIGNAGTRVALTFTTTRLGSCQDQIPAASRRPYPPDNDPLFPQEKHLTGIRARKTSLASLIHLQL